MLNYNRYIGMVEYDEEYKLFHGNVINISDVITFQGTTVEEIETSFRESVDDYINWCKEDGAEPQTPYLETVVVRLNPELHNEIVAKSKKLNMSVDRFIVRNVADELTQVS